MICPKCHTVFDMPANFCPQCGASLQRGGGNILVITAMIVLVLIIGAWGYVKYQLYQRADANRWSSQDQSSGRLLDRRPLESGKQGAEASEAPPLAITTGELILADINGRRILNAPIALLSSGWFAFPARAGIGASTWRVALPSGRLLEVEGGILHDTAPIGLWQLPLSASLGQTALTPWSPDRPLTWQPLDSPQTVLRVQVGRTENLTDFVRIPVDIEIDAPGVFVQNGKVVGWSFGTLMPGGYLWAGNPGTDLAVEFYPRDYYRLTFAGGREEAFLLALGNEALSDLQRLDALIAAYRLEPRLTAAETPAHISPAAIQAIMRELIIRLEYQGRAEDLLTLLDPQAILAVNDTTLAADLFKIAQELGAYAYANELIEAAQETNLGQNEQAQTLRKLQAALYRDWLLRLITDGNAYDAQQLHREATERFPGDPWIYLAGVELALQDEDWVQAESLLAARNYPPELRDTVSRLQRTISAMKSQEGKIVIRFRPGSRSIPVVARLGRDLDQRFVVDTGASLVTVPSSAARRLGIDISDSLPRRLFYSATGVKHAVEITLPSIELNGWAIENVRALVVDLPGQSDVGLLGMNYLSNFRMDVNTGEGVMLLEPR